MAWYLWVLGGIGIYVVCMEWLIFGRGAFRQVYSPLIARVLAWQAQQAITIGPTCFLWSAAAQLSEQGERHERFHYEQQQRRRPLTFFPVYLYRLLRYGYDHHPDEQAARAAAGEPLR